MKKVIDRYSDEDLSMFREILVSKLEKERKVFEDLMVSINHSDSNGTEDTAVSGFKIFEEGEQIALNEKNNVLLLRSENFILHLEAAITRIDFKKEYYGRCFCNVCKGGLIKKERLKIVPHATKCTSAKDN